MITEYNICVLKSNLGPPTLRPGLVIIPSKKESPNRFERHGGTGKEQGGRAVICPGIPREIRLGTHRTPYIHFILFN